MVLKHEVLLELEACSYPSELVEEEPVEHTVKEE
jgi:hypothetical protein